MDRRVDGARAIGYVPDDWRRPPRRPRATWRSTISADLNDRSLTGTAAGGTQEKSDLAALRTLSGAYCEEDRDEEWINCKQMEKSDRTNIRIWSDSRRRIF